MNLKAKFKKEKSESPVNEKGEKGGEKLSAAKARSAEDTFFDKEYTYALEKLSADSSRGLTDAEAESRLKQYGTNELFGGEGVKWYKVLLSNFFNPMNAVLGLAIILSSVASNWPEVAVVAAVVVTNTAIGFKQEYNSEKTMDALRKLASPTARVMRNGEVKVIQSTTVVPGDMLYIEEGDQVAADCRFMEVVNLTIDEALLTGESLPVKKQVAPITQDPATCQVGDRINMGFKNTTVAKGRGHGVVVRTGLETEIGAIAKSVMEGAVAQRTPLEKGMFNLMYALLGISIVIGIIIFWLNQWVFDFAVLVYCIAVAVAILPEGLPAVVTVTMAFGVKRMANQKAIVRRLVSLENLGAVTNICSDKTGTLTQGKMMVTRAWVGEEWFHVDGSADPNASLKVHHVAKDKTKTEVTSASQFALLDKAMTVCSLCHSSNLTKNENGQWVATGDPTELALVIFALRFNKTKQSQEDDYKFIAEAPFDSAIKRMTVVTKTKDGNFMCFAKGAIEGIFSRAIGYYDGQGNIVEGITTEYREMVNKNMEKMAKKGLRVLAVGVRDTSKEKLSEEEIAKMESGDDRDTIEKNFVFIGLVAMHDPPRTETAGAVQIAQGAGIIVHMATGDHPLTARTIAKEVGILRHPIREEHVMIAARFDQMTDEEVDRMTDLPLVLARCSPQSKVKLVRALHRRGKRVAMTGDGVNDAPAVKNADVGISMGQGGSDVTRQASDITLTDDNFATITGAVAEGRRIFANICKFALHLLSGNVSEVIALVFGLAVRDGDGRFIFPMSAVQILYLNLLTSSPVALALGVEIGSKDMMRQTPRKYGVFHFELIMDTSVYGAILGTLSLVSYILTVIWVRGTPFNTFRNCNDKFAPECQNIWDARGVGFYALSLGILEHGFVCRHTRRSTLKQKLKGSKWLVASIVLGVVLIVPTAYIPGLNTDVFKQGFVDGFGWAFVFVSLVIHLILSELYKLAKRMLMQSLAAVPIEQGEKAGTSEEDSD